METFRFREASALYFQDYNFFSASGWKFAKELFSKLDDWKRFSRKVIFSANVKRNCVLTRVKNSCFYFTRAIWKIQPKSFEASFSSNKKRYKNYEMRIKFVKKIVLMLKKSCYVWCIMLLIIMYVVVKFRITIIIYIYMMLILQKANGKIDTKEYRLKFIH